jgi:hypothetical protein
MEAAAAAQSEAFVFLGFFVGFPDPRQHGKVIYPLNEVLLLCLLAVLAGAETSVDIARFGQKKIALLRGFLPFRDGTPLAFDMREGRFSAPLTGASRVVTRLFSEILHCDLDAIVVHLLVFGLRLLTTLRAAMEELDHIRDWGTRRPIERVDPRRRSHIDQTVNIKVSHVVV